MKRLLKTIIGILAVCLIFLLCQLASEQYYFGTKRADGIAIASDYFRRFGEPSFIRMVERNGQSYYEFNGRVNPPWWCLAVPSAAPTYIFDERGRFIEWCGDPSDNSSYRQRWSLKSTDKIDIADVKRKFGL